MNTKQMVLIFGLFTIVTQSIFAGPQEDALFDAVEKEYIVGVENALKSGANVNAINEHSYTPLIIAVSKKNLKIIKYLLTVPEININAGDDQGVTVLMWTISNRGRSDGCFNCLKTFLNVPEINVNAQSENGMTALFLAAHRGDIECVRALLDVPGIDLTLKTKNILGSAYFSNKTAWDIASDEMKKAFPALQPKQTQTTATISAPTTQTTSVPVVSTTPAATLAN